MRMKDLRNRFLKKAEELTRLLPDWFTGRSEVIGQKYYTKYGTGDFAKLISRNKTRTMAVYLCITGLFLAAAAFSLFGELTGSSEVRSLQRPEFGTAVKSVPVEVQIKYKGYRVSKRITIDVKQKELSLNEKQELLENYSGRLKDLILGDNKDINHINKRLNLIERDPATGITINWISDRPELVDDNGNIDLIGAGKSQDVRLRAELALDDATMTETYKLKIDTNAGKEDYENSMVGRLRSSMDKLDELKNSEYMSLPGELDGGITLRWYTGRENNSLLLVLLFIFSVMIVYFNRYDRVNRELKAAEESVIRDLPEFINKLVLLLNAGLVVSTAFSKIVEDYASFYGTGSKETGRERKYLYDELAEIQSRINQTNVSLIKELKEFSQRSGVRELVRLTAVISDNWNKGSALAEKLEEESELLWVRRKKRAEEKGKIAETKLTFPLVILLLVLIMITIAPAMLDM
jgi:tight adherence protein C